MSRIWDALQRIEKQREEDVGEVRVPDRIQLTPKQHLAVRALLERDSVAEAARLAGVPERTLCQWLTQPGFIAAFYLAGRKQLEWERACLTAAADSAIDKLRQARRALTKLAAVANDLRRAAPPPAVDGAVPAEPDSRH